MWKRTRIQARFPVALKAVLPDAAVKTVISAVKSAVASKRRFSDLLSIHVGLCCGTLTIVVYSYLRGVFKCANH